MNNKVSVVIAAAGTGKRMNVGVCKQLIELDSKPILHYSISAFDQCKLIDDIIIVTNNSIILDINEMLLKFKYEKVKAVIPGGNERQDSVYNALKYLKKDPPKIVLIHDAVRPFITHSFIVSIIESAKNNSCVIPGIKLKDTLKIISDDDKHFEKTADRTKFRLIQTPQAFHFDLLFKAYEESYSTGYYGTDDSSLVEKVGVKPLIFEGSEDNFKITTQNDLHYAEILVKDFKQ
jgi:2-C-methyl-D-erythritol 4-phosphate cytidylyltransferase